MAIYFHEKQNFIYDSITKEYLSLVTEKTERAEYVPYPNNEDVGSYHFFEGSVTKIVKYNIGLKLLLFFKNVVKIKGSEKDRIIEEWKKMECRSESFAYRSACDDIGNIRAREINGY